MAHLSEFSAVFNSPIGKLGIKTSHDLLMGISFLPEKTSTLLPSCSLAKKVQEQLVAYFDGKLTSFNIPLKMTGTPFQQKVLQALCEIPFNQTQTYGDLAKKISTSPRAIGNACRRNPYPIIIPCHRVLAQNGMGGYSGARNGYLLDIKKWLLNHEQS